MFTRGQAWVDLILMANHKDASFRKRGIKVVVLRGQVGRTKDELSERWKWSPGKVTRFLKELESEQQISISGGKVNQIVTLLDYNKTQRDDRTDGNQIVEQTDNSQKSDERTDEEQIVEQIAELYKNEKKTITPASMCAYEAEPDLLTCYNSLLNSRIWYEPFCMNNHLTPQQFADYLKRFFSELQDRGETSKSEKDAKHHFSSWFKLNKNKNNEADRKLSKSDKTRNLVADIAAHSAGNADSLSDEEVLRW